MPNQEREGEVGKEKETGSQFYYYLKKNYLFDFLEIEMVKVATGHNKEKTKESDK